MTERLPFVSHHLIDDPQLGPAMQALTERQRSVVDWIVTTGDDNWSEAVRHAGYGDSAGGSARVTASRLKKDPRITDAIVEETRRRLKVDGLPRAANTLLAIVGNPAHKDAARVAKDLLATAGISPIHMQQTTVVHQSSAMDDIKALAALLGMSAQDLIRKTATGGMKDITPTMIEHEKMEGFGLADEDWLK